VTSRLGNYSAVFAASLQNRYLDRVIKELQFPHTSYLFPDHPAAMDDDLYDE
jgi:hypothetical protein